MHLKPHPFGLAAAVVTGLGYLLDAAFHYFAPTKSLQFYSYISFNLDFLKLSGAAMTWAGFLAGLVVWVVATYVCCAVFAWLYNKLLKSA